MVSMFSLVVDAFSRTNVAAVEFVGELSVR